MKPKLLKTLALQLLLAAAAAVPPLPVLAHGDTPHEGLDLPKLLHDVAPRDAPLHRHQRRAAPTTT